MSSNDASLATVLPVETAPGRKSTRRYKTFFKARDALNKALDNKELDLTGTRVAVFRYVLEHAWYNPGNDEDFGYVIESALGYETIARRLGVNEKTIRRAFQELDEKGLTSRYERPLLTGGREPDAIRVDWLLDTESDSEPDTESDSEPDTESGSSFSKETYQETTRAAARDDASAVLEEGQNQTQDEYLEKRATLASWLGMNRPSSINRNAVELADRLVDEYGPDIVEAAAQQCAREYRTTPVGLFVSSAESKCAMLAEKDDQENGPEMQAWRDARQREVDLLKEYGPRFVEIGAGGMFKHMLGQWKQTGHDPLGNFADVYPDDLGERLEHWLQKVTAKYNERLASTC